MIRVSVLNVMKSRYYRIIFYTHTGGADAFREKKNHCF